MSFALVLAAWAFFFFVFPGILPNDPAPGQGDALSPAEERLLEPGDIVLHRGVGLAADMIVLSMRESPSFTHGALILGKSSVQPIVVHSLSSSLGAYDGVQTAGFDYFNRKSGPDSIIVLRPRYKAGQKEAVLSNARELLDARVPFDAVYDLQDRSRLYCSEFLAEIFENSGFWSKERLKTLAGPVLAFSNFLDAREFTVVVSHLKPADL